METKVPAITRVLVPIDGSELSEQAIPYVVNTASEGTAVYLIRVVPVPEEISGIWGGVAATEAEVAAMSDDEAHDDILRAIKRFPSTLKIHTEIAHGDPVELIIQAALNHSVEMIVMTSHGRGAIGRLTFGSVADRVARESPVPVMIICPNAGDFNAESFERVVVPFDGSDLSTRAIPVATMIAKQCSVPIHLVFVISPATALYPTVAVSAPISDESYERILTNERIAAEQQLGACAMALHDAGIEASFEIEVGPTVEGIELALKPRDVVVIGSHGRGGIRRWLLGSIAERLIRDGKAPVVLVPSHERQRVTSPAAVHIAHVVPQIA